MKKLSLVEPWNNHFDSQCTLEDIYHCFRLLLGRLPQKHEWPGHSGFAGGRLEDVVSIYLNSLEFKNRKLGLFEADDIELMDIEGFKFYVPKNDQLLGRCLYNTKTYEPHITKFLRKNLISGHHFLDVGANIGYFSMLSASLVGSNGRIYSFEPFSFNVKLLCLNKQVNEFENIEIFPLALSDKSSLYLYNEAGTNGVISPIVNDFRSVFDSTLVYSVTLDEMSAKIARLDFVKVDIEGAEYLMLMGGKKLLTKHCPVIISEFSPASIEAVSKVSPEEYLHELMLDETYELLVFEELDVTSCHRDPGKVMSIYEQKGCDHIDIIAAPNPSGLRL
ncbi:MAG: FkbM family methyltransferase [Desulforhabdus sp.]|jgi:FkbM family methyltransferase|nr:FkbM family methyltransferase [Desulforhabdus sp.]